MPTTTIPTPDVTSRQHGEATYGFTVEIHPSGHSMYDFGEQIILTGDMLLTKFDEFHKVFNDDPKLIYDDKFIDALTEYVVSGIRTDIEVFKETADEIDESVDPYIEAYEAAIGDVKTEIQEWADTYQDYIKLERPEDGVRDDHELFEFMQEHPYDFHGICDMHDIIIGTLDSHVSDT